MTPDRVPFSRLVAFLGLAASAGTLGLPRISTAQVEVRSDLREQQHVQPGASYSGTIVLRNPTNRPQEVRISKNDYGFSADGRIDFAVPGTRPRSNAAWLSVNPSFVTIPPLQTARIAYTAQVPATGVAGTYWSVLMVEGGDEQADAQPSAGNKPGLTLRTKVRHAIQVVTHVGETGKHGAKFLATRAFRAPSGEKSLEVDIENTGDVSYRLMLTLELFDEQGRSVAKLTQSSDYLYPGTSARQRFNLKELPAGSYQALLLADSGADEIFGAQYRLTF